MTAQAPGIQLPEPADTLWSHAGSAILAPETVEWMTGGSPGSWSIGGGTILAARWRHRRSSDIDIAVPPGVGERRTWIEPPPQIKRAWEKAGAVEIRTSRIGASIRFPQGKIDIFESAPMPEGAEYTAAVHGRPTRIQTAEQILHGKIAGRLARAPTRDLFDFAVAGEIDLWALEKAVNREHPREVALQAGYALNDAAGHADLARTALEDVAPEFQALAADPAARGVGALLAAQYRGITVQWDGTSVEMEAVRSDGTRRSAAMSARTPGEVELAAERMSVTPYLRNAAEADGMDRLKGGDRVDCGQRPGARLSRRDQLPQSGTQPGRATDGNRGDPEY